MEESSWECQSSSKLFLVSDIDDTLKRTHRLSSTGMLKKGMRSRNAFAGMSELYRSFCSSGLDCAQSKELSWNYQACIRNPHRQVAYVTSAISKLQWFSCLFLVRSQFPLGLYMGRSHGSALEHKTKCFFQLAEDFQSHDFIFVGDNGEDDPKAFELVEKKFRANGRRVCSFVHAVYDKTIPSGQIPFLTSVDLGLHFFARGWIEEADLKRVVDHVISAIHENSRKLLPRWVSSPEVREYWPETPGSLAASLSRQIELVRRFVVQKMNQRPRFQKAVDLFEFQ